MGQFEGKLEPASGRFAVVAARFNSLVTTRLVDGALSSLAAAGVGDQDIDLVWVPGSFEIPLVAKRLASSGGYAAVICLGCVIQGQTEHYRYVASEAARGIMDAALTTGVPVVFGVLTTETVEQALQRAGPGRANKGAEAARTALQLANLLGQLPA